MKNTAKVITAALLGVTLICGTSLAQNRPPNDQGQPNRPRFEGRPDQGQRPEGRPEMNQRPGQPQPPNPDGIMENPKVQAEMKRHGEVMKGFFEQIKTLREKIKKALESEIGNIERGGPGGPPNGQSGPNNRGRQGPPPNQPPNGPGNRGRGEGQQPPDQNNGQQPPNRQGNPEGFRPPQGEEPKGPTEEVKKLLETFRAEADAIADKIAAEIVTHHQNLAKIVAEEKDNIKKTISDRILMPPPPPNRPQGQGGAIGPEGQGGQNEQGNQGGNQGKGERRGPPPRDQGERRGPPPQDNENPDEPGE